MIYSVDEEIDENVYVKVDGILQEIQVKPPGETVSQIGIKHAEKCRPVIDSVNQVLKKSKLLRTKRRFKLICTFVPNKA